LPAFDYLFTKLSSAATEVENYEYLFTNHYRNCINAGFLKLKEYYRYSDQSRFYRAAVALHPTMRFHYFEAKWKHLEGGRDYIEGAKEAVQSLFEEYLANNPSTAPAAATPPLSHIARASSDDDEDYRTFFDFTLETDIDQERQRKRQKQESELDRFMTDEMELYYFERQMVNGQWKEVKLSYKDNPLAWWRQHGERLYPTLSRMAYDLFSMPAMSSECERAFSLAKKMITDERYSLKPDIIEADQCLKSWLKQGLVSGEATWQLMEEMKPSEEPILHLSVH